MTKCPKDNVFYRNLNWHYPKIAKGKGIYLYGEDGEKYIDACSGSAVANIGHGNEEVAKAMEEQAKTIAFTHLSRFTTDAIQKLSDLVAELTPGDLNKCYYVSGGSEATETAIKMTRQYYLERDGGKTTKYKIIARKHSFHGNTIGSLSMTGHSARRKRYTPYLADFPHIEAPYCYRCPYGSEYPQCGVRCAYALENEIKEQGPENVAAFIAEPVVGSACPGMYPPKEYFKIVRDICDEYDVLLIIDEVMAGFGRTGKNFGIDHYEVVPDMITTAKGMSCGYAPLGAAIVKDKIYDTFAAGSGRFVHGHTYGGNPLSCGIGAKVLEICKRENYYENSRIQGEYLMEKLQEFYDYPFVGNITGKGLMLGIEFVKDQETREPFEVSDKFQPRITKNCLENGVVVYPGGGHADGIRGDNILVAPPINITREEVDEMLECMHKGFKKTAEQLS